MLNEEMKEKDLPLMIEVESSTIEKMGYKEETKQLFVQFKGFGVYRYENVLLDEFEVIKNAKSVGKEFHKGIKIHPSKHPYVSITIIKES